MPSDGARALEVKTRVEALKERVRTLQGDLPAAKMQAESSYPRRQSSWDAYHAMRKSWSEAVRDLGAAKLELTRLSGTTGTDPRWKLVYEAYHLLSTLDEGGVDIGKRGEDLLEAIEFHCPTAKLNEHAARIAAEDANDDSPPRAAGGEHG